jgi:hypothetical protein
MPPTLSPVAAREIVHLLILRALMGIRRGSGITVKGGVNLRLFFGSVRYSEDMDLDGTAQAGDAIRATIHGMFEDKAFTHRLRTFGIRELDPGEGPNKDTETTFRYKFGVVVGGGIRYSTRVEVSFRERHDADRAVIEAPPAQVLRTYGMDPFEVRHYGRDAAVRQKLDALGGRREAQARDVFDLHMLAPDPAPQTLVRFLAREMATGRLKEAHARALAISYAEYEGQVFEFLGHEARRRYATERAWDEMRLGAATMIESGLKLQERT